MKASPPAKLFKYVSPKPRVVDSLFGHLLIRYTPPFRFNDPFDMLPCIEPVTDSDRQHSLDTVCRMHYRRFVLSPRGMGAPPPSFDEFRNKWLEQNQPNLNTLKGDYKKRALKEFQKDHEDVGVLSLTANDESLLMWAHYAQSHEGMLIEFRPSKMFTEPEKFLVRVEYSSNRPSVNIGVSGQQDDFSKKTAPYRVKSCEWQYEAEWRAFALLSTCDKRVVSDENEVIQLFRLSPYAIQRIVLGRRISKPDQEMLLRAVKSNRELRHVRIEHAEIDEKEFRLKYMPGPNPF